MQNGQNQNGLYVANVLGPSLLPAVVPDQGGNVRPGATPESNVAAREGGQTWFNVPVPVGGQGVFVQYGDDDGVCALVSAPSLEEAEARLARAFGEAATVDDLGESSFSPLPRSDSRYTVVLIDAGGDDVADGDFVYVHDFGPAELAGLWPRIGADVRDAVERCERR